MRTAPPRLLGAALVLAVAALFAGCGKAGRGQPAGGEDRERAPAERKRRERTERGEAHDRGH